MDKTAYIKAGDYILKDLQRNAPVNNNAKDSYLKETYKNKPSDDNLTNNLNVHPSLYYDRYGLYFKNKVLDECICNPMYDYEANGGRDKVYLNTAPIRTGLNYYTPPLQRASSRY